MEQNYNAKQERHLVKDILGRTTTQRNYGNSLVLRVVTKLNLPRNPVKERIQRYWAKSRNG